MLVAAVTVVWLGSILDRGVTRADAVGHFTTTKPFDDVLFDLENAILQRGLSQHSSGNFGKMLERTGADVGSTKAVYTRAEFVEICSAKFARMMVEADPTLMSNCPFLFYVYERHDRTGERVVGFRKLAPGTTPQARSAVTETEAMLDAIARVAAK